MFFAGPPGCGQSGMWGEEAAQGSSGGSAATLGWSSGWRKRKGGLRGAAVGSEKRGNDSELSVTLSSSGPHLWWHLCRRAWGSPGSRSVPRESRFPGAGVGQDASVWTPRGPSRPASLASGSPLPGAPTTGASQGRKEGLECRVRTPAVTPVPPEYSG